MKTKWILCPVCGNKTRDRIRENTVLKNYPLYCPKCKHDHHLYLDEAEQRLKILCLNEFRNRLIAEGRYTDCVDELLIKAAGAKTVKLKIR